MIKVENLSFAYAGEESRVQALQDVSFSVKEGEWVAICGHNGSGKSTMARLIDGLLAADSGQITVDGIPLTEDSVWDVRSRIGMVFQNPDNQFVGVSVEDDVAFGLENQGVDPLEMPQRIERALDLVGMSDFKSKEPARLSGGQKQRVAIASVLALQPKIMILDEATAMLDPKGRKQIIQVVKDLKEKMGLTVLSITHDIDEALLADRVLVMQEGTLVFDGKPHELFESQDQALELGLDLPYPEVIRRLLAQEGIQVPEHYLNEVELEDWLCQLLLTK